ncbi:hypothetical protein [Blastopirellula marina]|uniref:Uncharacterized protein n=1 Tax=Blastopirellula marina TaxID=124 RepID=A0A2S8F307_9BACT|nr:hypothetical protein [Blastopirellula marina]PQO26546.1 hypothetical protein C5Y98_29590 [Blastopirellula marina]PTL40857.1 hypothetical protein C5Y97_29605 [Blastopirellula marina]
MELNRNQYFMIGLIVLALGIQFRIVDSVTLTEEASTFIAKRIVKQQAAAGEIPPAFVPAAESQASAKRTINPPEWLGWALISVGGVLILHSLAMQKPG